MESKITVTLTEEELGVIRTSLSRRMATARKAEEVIHEQVDTADRSYTASALALDYWRREYEKASALFYRMMRDPELIG